MSGLDIKRFISEIPDEVICGLCKNVLSYPDSIEDNAGHCFCKACIDSHLQNDKKCPIDGSSFLLNSLKPISAGFKGLFGKLKLKCKYEEYGCQIVCCLKELIEHENNCTHYSEKCTKCKIVFKNKEMQNHDCISYLLKENNGNKNEIISLKRKAEELSGELESYKKKSKHQAETVIEQFQQKYSNNIKREFIDNKITNIGKNKVSYKKYMKSESLRTIFAINNNGLSCIVGFNNNALAAVLTLYNPDGSLKKKINLAGNQCASVGLSDNDMLYLVTVDKKIEISLYDSNLNRIKTHAMEMGNIVTCVRTLNIIENNVYFRATQKYQSNSFETRTYVFDKDLNGITETFHITDHHEPIFDVKITPDLIVYDIKNEIYIKSRQTKELIKKFEIKPDEVDFDIAPNGNIFVLYLNGKLLEEFNLNGELIKSQELNIENGIQIHITNNFTIGILAKRRNGFLYLA